MTITCPRCGFSREADAAQVPAGAVAVTCPRCEERFTLQRDDAGGPPPEPPAPGPQVVPEIEAKIPGPPPVRCPACGEEQPAGERCGRCGAAFVAAPQAELQPPFAGFWVRVVAAIIDSAIVSVVQFVLGLLLAGAVGLLTGPLGGGGEVGMTFLTALFGMVLAVAYYVFFTGYGGQTPGKMAMRLKVVRTDGTAVSYGRAFLREVVGKFLSGILLGIGYLMVAFDARKQGLHDKMADTLVIKI